MFAVINVDLALEFAAKEQSIRSKELRRAEWPRSIGGTADLGTMSFADVSERLFHGTSEQHTKSIVEHGFDPRLAAGASVRCICPLV